MGVIGLVFAMAFVILTIAGLVMEKSLRAKYNGAVGLLNSFLFTGGLLGGIGLIMMMFTGGGDAEMLIAGIVCVVLAVLMLATALRKCPAGSKSVPGIIVAMLMLGGAAYMRIFGFLMKLVFHFDMFAGRDPGAGYAAFYQDSNGSEYQLWTSNGSYAVLKGPDGALFDVRPHGNDGLVSDDRNNIYYPM